MPIDRDRIKAAAPFLIPFVRAWHRCVTAWHSRPEYVTRHAPFLAPDVFERVLFDNRGNHPTQHIRTTKRFVEVAGANVLAVGCRNGREIQLWLDHGARSVTALDYVARAIVWRRIGVDGTRVRFMAADARQLPFGDSTFDIVSSEALLEHVVHPDAAIAEFHRVVKPAGLVYSIFGPLFFTAGGAHYQGEYEHLTQDPDAFDAWLSARARPSDEEGLSYLRAGMFSRWTADQYLREFSKYDVLYSAVLLSPEGRQFQRRDPGGWARLRATYSERDLMINGLAFWSKKVVT